MHHREEHRESILTIIVIFQETLAATQNKYTERRIWRRGLAGKCSCNVERVHIGCRLTAIYMVHVALNYCVAASE